MRKTGISVLLLIAGSLLGATSAWAVDASGKLLSANGGVLIQRGMQTNSASNGSLLAVGDTILTTDTGHAQWRMADDSLFALAINTGLKINRYELPTQGNPAGIASYTLLQGAMHVVTGRIGQAVAANDVAARSKFASLNGRFNPAFLLKVAETPASANLVKTALANITTKSADYAMLQSEKQLELIVTKGEANVCNGSGCTMAGAGQALVVYCVTCKPILVLSNTLALNDMMAGLQFQSTDAVASVNVNDPRVGSISASTPASPPVPASCLAIASQLMPSVCVPPVPGLPVSPN